MLLFYTYTAKAQLYHKASVLTTNNGLSDNRVTCFYKDHTGFIWIGTRNGLNRFDGHRFKIFQPSVGNSISNEIINDIDEDSRGRLWVATQSGLNCYDPATNYWQTLLPDASKERGGLPNNIVWHIQIDKNDCIWIASDVYEFCNYNSITKKYTYYDWPGFVRKNIDPNRLKSYSSIQRFIQKNDHEFWLGTTRGLVSLNTLTNKFQLLGSGYKGAVLDMKYDTVANKVFLSVEGGKLFEYDAAQNNYRQLLLQNEPFPSLYYPRGPESELFLASEKGLVKINKNRKQNYLSVPVRGLPGSLLPGAVNNVFDDRNNIRWIATTNGINIYDTKNTASSFLPLLPGSDKENFNGMGSVFYDSVSNCYFACSILHPAVFIINAGTGTIDKLTKDILSRPFTSCNAIKKDNHNNLWLLTNNQVYRYIRNKNAFELFPLPNKGSLANFTDFIEDEVGNYWFASFHKSIYCYSPGQKQFITIADSNLKYVNAVTSLVSDPSRHSVWIGSFATGVFRFDIPSKKLYNFFEITNEPGFASLNLIHDIVKDAGNRIWLATDFGGLFRYNDKGSAAKSFTGFNMKTGLKNNSFISICNNGDSILWLLSGRGISAISTSGKFLFALNEKETFPFTSFTSDNSETHCIFFNKNKNELLLGIAGGLFLYSTSQSDSEAPVPIILTSLRIGADTILPDKQYAATVHNISYRSNTIAIEFAGLYYGSSTIHYQYKLEGYEKDWINADNNFSARYQNLPAGNYVFHLKAINNSGDTIGELDTFSFKVTPPFWRTGWFVGLLILLIVAILSWFFFQLQQKIKEERLLKNFTASLYGQSTTEDIFWDIAKNCVEKIGFSDCVIYQLENKNKLVQKAAFGPKNPDKREILNPIDIPLGKGIVGSVAKTGVAEIVNNTAADKRYIMDDERRLSEITVPIIIDGKVFAIIDSEHPQKKFYTSRHLQLLKKIAAISAERLYKYLTEENLRAKIARDLHDEMGSTLSSINIISKVALQQHGMADKVKNYLASIKDYSLNMMENMSDMVWAINPQNDNMDSLVSKIKEWAAEICESREIALHFETPDSFDNLQIDAEKRKHLFLIFKEALNNAVKYSQCRQINITISQQGINNIEVSIMDDGVGFNMENHKKGNGLANMKTRAAQLNATINIHSIQGQGTTIELVCRDV